MFLRICNIEITYLNKYQTIDPNIHNINEALEYIGLKWLTMLEPQLHISVKTFKTIAYFTQNGESSCVHCT